MKKYILLIIFSFLAMSCNNQKSITDPKKIESVLKPEKNDDGEWDLEVIDTQYDYFLTAIAKPMDYYSESYLKSRNSILVSEWNSYYYAGRFRNVVESYIDYNPNENYGKKFEYKLYQVFAYAQWKYGLKLNGLSATEIR